MEKLAPASFAALLPPRYRIERVLSEGGRSATVQAFDTGLHQAPAILKVERLSDEATPDVEAGFRRFCATLAALQSDLLAVPYTFGTLAPGPGQLLGYTVRAYVNGTPLSALSLPMPTDDALLAMLQVCQGLDVLHAKEIFHSDLKPENVIVRHAAGGRIDERSRCVLIDIAYRPEAAAKALTEVTLQYVAPEMLEGKPADRRTDLYAVGVMAYRLLTGRLPFDANSLPAMIRKQRAREFSRLATLRPDIPSGLCDAVERLLEPNPGNRPESAQALIALLNEHAGPISTDRRAAARSSRFVGREAELGACIAALDLDRPSGGVSSIEVSGPRGCGVTAFLRELQDRLEARGVTVLTAAPRAAGGAALPAQLIDAVHSLARRPHSPSGDPGRVRAPTTPTDLLDDLLVATQDRRVVLFVDDWRLGDVGETRLLQRVVLQDKAATEASPGRTGRCQVILGSPLKREESAAATALVDMAKQIRLDGLSTEDVARLVEGDDSVPRAFVARLHSATGGLPAAIHNFLDKLPCDHALPSTELDELLRATTRSAPDLGAHEIQVLRAAPGGQALIALALWGEELPLSRWRTVMVTLGVHASLDLLVDRVERRGEPLVRSRHKYLSECVARHLPDSELDSVVDALLVANRDAWKSNDPAELLPLLRFVARLGRPHLRCTWRTCRALLVLLEQGHFADVESASASLLRLPGAPWWVAVFLEAARAQTAASHGTVLQDTEVGDPAGFFRSWIRARRLLHARYRSEAYEILTALVASGLGVVPAVSLALAEDRALAAAEAGQIEKFNEVTRWMLGRVRRALAVAGGRRRPGTSATVQLGVGAARKLARYQRVRARAHALKGRTDRALTACRKERLLARAGGNKLREASCLNNEGILLFRTGGRHAAVAALERSIRLRERLDDECGLAVALINLAGALASTGNLGGAASVLNRARIVASRNSLDRLRNLTLLNLAIAYNRRGQLRDARRVLRQVRRLTRNERDAEAHARALYNSGQLAADQWSPLVGEQCAQQLDRASSPKPSSEVSGDLIRAELAYRGRDWAHLHTLTTRLREQGIEQSYTAVYDARIALEAGDRLRKNAGLERRAPAKARLRLILMRRQHKEIRSESLARVVRIARTHATAREAVEWIAAHLDRSAGNRDSSLDLGLKVLSWFEFREGHDDLQIEIRARLASMMRTRGRDAEAWRLIEDALLMFRRLERRLRRWPRGVHVLLDLHDRIRIALNGPTTGTPNAAQEMSAALCVEAFDLLMDNRRRAVGANTRYSDALVRLGSAIGRGGDQETIIDEVLSVALGLTGAQRVALVTGTAESHGIRRTLFAGGEPPPGAGLDMSWAVVSQVLASGEASLFSDALTSEELASHRSIATFKLRSLACVPLRAGGQVLGALYLDHHGIAGLITSEMLGFLELLASLLALTFRMGRAEEQAAKAHLELTETHRHLMRAERNRVAGELAGGLVHDLKNVLAAVSGRAQLLRRVNEDPNVLRTLDAIEKAAGTGAGLLQRLQECSRDHSSQREEAVDLVVAALEALELLGPRLEKGHVQVDVKAITGAVVWGTPGEYREMFLNLFVNACDAMPEGGTLTVAFHAEAETRKIEASVRDTGVGMSAETQSRIFEPFFTTKGNQGTGLGLVVVRSVIVRRGGAVSVESSPGAGTCFRVVVPAFVHAPENEKGRLESKRPEGSSA